MNSPGESLVAAPGAVYRVVRRFCRFTLRVFYRRIEVRGLEHLPEGPAILVANHNNGLVDPMLMVAAIPRWIVPVAKSTLFPHPLIGPFLRAVGAIPVYRRQDPGVDPRKNVALFRLTEAALREGKAILIFPEGTSQAEPVLLPLHRGAARMALGAARQSGGKLVAAVVPVGLVFHRPETLRDGWGFAVVGPPVPLEDLLTGEDAAAAERELTSRVERALRGLILEARDREALRLLEHAEGLVFGEPDLRELPPSDRAAWRRRALRAATFWYAHDRGRMERLERDLEAHLASTEHLGLGDAELPRTYPAGAVLRYALREGASLLVGLPLALWGLANHVVPFAVTWAAARAMRPDPSTEASVKIAAGVVFYPVCWALLGWWILAAFGGWALALFAASLVPTGLFALAWRERLRRFRRDARGFLTFLVRRDLHAELVARRAALRDEIAALIARVPEADL